MMREYSGDLLLIVGPTAVGKTALSLELAKEFRGEIISGDSMQIYRGMDIGTAKVSVEEQKLIPHHLIDIKDPHESFSVAEFQSLALRAIGEIQERGRLPILVGGTGLYIKAVLYYPHYVFTDQKLNAEIRDRWQKFLAEHGEQALWEEVNKIDPTTASRLHPNDTRRLIRALELYEETGQPMSQIKSSAEGPLKSPFRFLMIGLTMPRELLYERINQRVLKMFEDGLIEEVKRLYESGLDLKSTAMQSLGYKEVIPYLEGNASLDETIELIQRKTRQFAKRQLTWFRHMPEIIWFDGSPEHYEKNIQQIKRIAAGKFQSLENK